MAAQALYRRWRPQTFDDVIGQEHVTRTLQNAVNGDRLAHAYLFTGVRGTGKTSVARILAKAVNCTGPDPKPCNACPACLSITAGRALDLIEIDAASNTGVDDVRDLRDKIGFAPNELAYKVYIVDEVHMLSTAAFNALLKTLEEPPPHALFILATTEPHKVPDTILSRCQRHDFRRVPREALVAKLARICAAEGVAADEEALALIARNATGSFRDAESLLDQLLASGEALTLDLVRDILGTPATELVMDLVEALVSGDAPAGLRAIGAALDQGVDPRQLQSQVLAHLRALLLLQVGLRGELLDLPEETLVRLGDQATRLAPAVLTGAIHRFNDARPSPDRSQPSLPLELALVETVLAATQPSPAASAASQAAATAAQPQPAAVPRSQPAAAAQRQATAPAPLQAATNPASSVPVVPAPSAPVPAGRAAAGAELAQVLSHWDEVLARVAARDKSTAALLRDCRPLAADAATVTLGFFYEFHCGRVAEPNRSKLVAGALAEVLGSERALVCTVVSPSPTDTASRPRTKKDQAQADPLVRHAVEQLGAQITSVQSTEETGS